MIQLFSNLLSPATNVHLSAVQGRISREASFKAKCEKAKSEWTSKQSSQAAQAAFKDIKTKLKEMCSGTSICVYCEHNEATDIEHIYPKRLFPDKAFNWENYVLACGNCNTHYKKDRFKVFVPAQGAKWEDVTPVSYSIYNEPKTDDAVFINQRIEDPMSYLELDFIHYSFYFIETHQVGTREYEKANYTKEILGLNTRADLVQQRKTAFSFYKNELAKYISIKESTSLQELVQRIDGITDSVNQAVSFTQEQLRLKETIKNRIVKHTHRTVWKEMIRQRHQLPTCLALFNQAPEAIDW